MPSLRLISGWAACALAVSLLMPSAAMPGPAAINPREMAAIEATAPFDDPTPSGETVEAAIAAAVEKVARGGDGDGTPLAPRSVGVYPSWSCRRSSPRGREAIER